MRKKPKSNYSGAGEEYKHVRENYCDEDGYLCAHKVAEYLIKIDAPSIPPDEWQRILREGPNGERKKKDNNTDPPA